jgi:hypothetical protein
MDGGFKTVRYVHGDMLDGATYGLVGALVLLHVLTLAYAYRRRTGRSGGPDGALEADAPVPVAPVPGEFDADTVTVSCERCGTENAAEYAFCRACVTQLPTATPVVEGGAGTFRSGSA